MVLGQAFAVFQAFSRGLKSGKTAEFKVAFPKTEVLGKPLLLSMGVPPGGGCFGNRIQTAKLG
jgi:hypothetical protein